MGRARTFSDIDAARAATGQQTRALSTAQNGIWSPWPPARRAAALRPLADPSPSRRRCQRGRPATGRPRSTPASPLPAHRAPRSGAPARHGCGGGLPCRWPAATQGGRGRVQGPQGPRDVGDGQPGAPPGTARAAGREGAAEGLEGWRRACSVCAENSGALLLTTHVQASTPSNSLNLGRLCRTGTVRARQWPCGSSLLRACDAPSVGVRAPPLEYLRLSDRAGVPHAPRQGPTGLLPIAL